MLVDEAAEADDREHDRLLAKADAEGVEGTFDAEALSDDGRDPTG